MDTVATLGRGWKMMMAAVIVGGAGWLSLNGLTQSLVVSIAGAMTGAPTTSPPSGASCTCPGAGDQHWQRRDIQLVPDARTSSDVGSATISVQPTSKARTGIRWNADLGIDAIVLRGEGTSQLVRFDHERYAGRARLDNGQPIDKVTFCYDFELTVNKDANPSLTRRFDWSIDESVDPAEVHLKPGASATSTYRIAVTRDKGTASDWRVDGTITIDNLTPMDTTLEQVSDVTSDGIASKVDCGVPLPGYVLRSGQTLTCRYLTRLPDGAARQATTHVQTAGPVHGTSVTSAFNFAGADEHLLEDHVLVKDNRGRSWTFDHSGAATYKQAFRCDGDAGLHPSAARIVGTAKQASTAVSVECQSRRGGTTASRSEHH